MNAVSRLWSTTGRQTLVLIGCHCHDHAPRTQKRQMHVAKLRGILCVRRKADKVQRLLVEFSHVDLVKEFVVGALI